MDDPERLKAELKFACDRVREIERRFDRLTLAYAERCARMHEALALLNEIGWEWYEDRCGPEGVSAIYERIVKVLGSPPRGGYP